MSGSHQRSSSTWHCVSPQRGNRDSPQAGRSAESNGYLLPGLVVISNPDHQLGKLCRPGLSHGLTCGTGCA